MPLEVKRQPLDLSPFGNKLFNCSLYYLCVRCWEQPFVVIQLQKIDIQRFCFEDQLKSVDYQYFEMKNVDYQYFEMKSPDYQYFELI